jgi:hypothetical protein
MVPFPEFAGSMMVILLRLSKYFHEMTRPTLFFSPVSDPSFKNRVFCVSVRGIVRQIENPVEIESQNQRLSGKLSLGSIKM